MRRSRENARDWSRRVQSTSRAIRSGVGAISSCEPCEVTQPGRVEKRDARSPFDHSLAPHFDPEPTPNAEICHSLAISSSRHSSADDSTFPLSLVACSGQTCTTLQQRPYDELDAYPRFRDNAGPNLTVHATRQSCFTRRASPPLALSRILEHSPQTCRKNGESLVPRFTGSRLASSLGSLCLVRAHSSGSTRDLDRVRRSLHATATQHLRAYTSRSVGLHTGTR